jgi:hypothetical protein
MKRSLLLVAAIAITAISACADQATPTPTLAPNVDIHPYGVPFDLRVADSAFLFADGEPYRLDLASIASDSRCPAAAECLRPDVAVIEVTLTDLAPNGGTETHNLFFDSGRSEAAVGPFTVQVLELTPTVGEVTSPADYVVTLLTHETPAEKSLDVQVGSSATRAQVRDRVTYTARASSATGPLSHAQYTLTASNAVVGITRDDGTLTRGSQTAVIELVEWTADDEGASWTIEVLSVGEFEMEVSILASIAGGQSVVWGQGGDSASLSVN